MTGGRTRWLLVLALPWSLGARTWTVDAAGSGDFVTVQAAVDAASDRDRVEVFGGTYAESVLVDGKNLEIVGVDGAAVTILLGPEGGVALTLLAVDTATTIEGLTLSAPGGQGLSIAGGSPTVRSCTFEHNGSADVDQGGAIGVVGGSPVLEGLTFGDNEARNGGDIAVSGGATVWIEDCTFAGSQAAHGGAIWIDGSTVAVARSTFTGLRAAYDGGATFGSRSVLEVMDSTFVENAALRWYGGAICVLAYGEIDISGSLFQDNWAHTDGGAIEAQTSEVRVSDSTFEDNRADDEKGVGGAIYHYNWDTEIERSSFSGNRAAAAGAVYAGNGDLTTNESTFEGNQATVSGGAILVYNLNEWRDTGSVLRGNTSLRAEGGGAALVRDVGVDLDGTTFEANAALQGDGGGLYVEWPTEESRLDHVTFSGNVSGGVGGGVYYDGYASLSVDDSSFAGNSAAGHGGGLAWGVDSLGPPETLRVSGSVFADNQAGGAGGGLYADDDEGVHVEDGTFAGNVASGLGANVTVTGRGADLVNNVLAFGEGRYGVYVGDEGEEAGSFEYNNAYGNADEDVGGIYADSIGAGGNLSADPAFVRWSADGDPTNDDLRLQCGSPCIDAGDPAEVDDDGTRSDIGALGLAEPDCDGDSGGSGDTARLPDTASFPNNADADRGVRLRRRPLPTRARGLPGRGRPARASTR